MTKYFDIPFANSGDKTPIPEDPQPGGQVSYAEGYTVDYTLNQATNPAAKDVPRQEHNQLEFNITELLKEIQEAGLLPYRADVNYLVFAYVMGTDGNLYKSTALNGPDNAATGSVLSFSDNGAGGTTVTTTAALPGSIINGIDITLSGTTNYNGTFEIFNTATPDFDIPVPFVGDDATGTWDFSGVVNPVGDTSGIWVDPISGGGIIPGSPAISVSADDTTLGNLEDKLTAGANITLTTLNPGGNESVEVAADTGDKVDKDLTSDPDYPPTTTIGDTDIFYLMKAGVAAGKITGLDLKAQAAPLYTLLETRTTIGTWTIAGLTIGRPLFMGGDYRNVVVNSIREVRYRVESGSILSASPITATTSQWEFTATNGSGPTPGSCVLIPTATSVVIEIETMDTGTALVAYQ